MKDRNSERNKLKLANWNEYVKTIDFSVPSTLEEKSTVDKLIVFNSKNQESTALSLKNSLKIINGKGL